MSDTVDVTAGELCTREVAVQTIEGRTITGLLLPYDQPSIVQDSPGGPRYPEIYARGSGAGIDPRHVRMYDGHRRRIGVMVRGWDTPEGYMTQWVVNEGPAGDRALTRANQRLERGEGIYLSAGFWPDSPHETRPDGTIVRTRVDLVEGSLVDRPQHPTAIVTSIRGDSPVEDETTTDTDESTDTDTDGADESTTTPDLATRGDQGTGAVTSQLMTRLENVIGEVLERQTPDPTPTDPQLELMERGEYYAPPEHLPTDPETGRLIYRSFGEFMADYEMVTRPGAIPSRDALDRLERAVADSASGDMGGAVPPIYINRWIDATAVGAPLLRRLGFQPLADTGLVLHQPKTSQSTLVGPRAAETDENTSQQFTSSDVTTPVEMYSGVNGMTYEARTRTSPSAWDAMLRDQAAAWFSRAEAAVVNDDGTGNTITGILQTAGIGAETVAAWTAANLIAALADSIGNVLAATNGSPVVVAMHTRRWAKIIQLLDSTNRPIVNVGGGPQNTISGGGSLATLTGGSPLGGPAQSMGANIMGLEPVLTNAIPTDLGGGTEDIMMVISGEAFTPYLEANAPFTMQTTYAADFIVNASIGGLIGLQPEKPAGVSTIGGAGLVP